MNSSKADSQALLMLEDILSFLEVSSGLRFSILDNGDVQVRQSLDGRKMTFAYREITEVLDRTDSEGQRFIQVNFLENKKVLFTDSLVGFKPLPMVGLDLAKLPKVVTTPDLLSVMEALSDSLSDDKVADYECEILKKVYRAILEGGLKVGFELDAESDWLKRLFSSSSAASA